MNSYICSASNPHLFWTVKESEKKGSNIILQEFTGAPEQEFQIFPKNIVSGCSGMTVDIKGGSNVGSDIIQWSYNGNQNQTFNFTPNGNVVSANLAIAVKYVAAGQSLIAAAASPADKNQKWRIVTRK